MLAGLPSRLLRPYFLSNLTDLSYEVVPLQIFFTRHYVQALALVLINRNRGSP